MKSRPALRSIWCLPLLLMIGASNPEPSQRDEPAPRFEGTASAWHDGFQRFDYLLDDASGAIQPAEPDPAVRFGVGNPPPGKHRGVVVVPRNPAPGNPWSWRGCYWDHEPQTEVELLRRGFHVAYLSASASLKPDKTWDTWYDWLTQQHGLARRPAFVGMSRGGQFAYTWASTHPDQVACIYADNPAISPEIIARLGDLARADVPLLHVVGSIDPLLPQASATVETIYRQLGGRISVMIKDGAGHHPHSLRDPLPIADFITASVQPRTFTPPPFVPSKFTRISFTSPTSSYRFWPSENLFLTCRGPAFAPTYDRLTFALEGVEGMITVITPAQSAPEHPWVFRANPVDEASVVDLALLADGFHIVTGPVPFNANGPSLRDWNTTYTWLTNHGFAARPVLAGAGGAAGEAYAWAIANPSRVASVYAENPILRGTMTPHPPLDHLEPLARQHIPILHVCGSLDPSLASQTRVATQRYETLGGSLRVIVQEGVGHDLRSFLDPVPIVEWIRQSCQPR